jgi:large subunit ribosomal protein L19
LAKLIIDALLKALFVNWRVRVYDKNDMNKKLLDFNKTQKESKMPDFRAGDVVKVHRKIIEGGKERIQIFEGIIIAIKGKQSSSATITVRKVSNGVGVELVLPIQSPIIDKIELVKRAKVRRAKLYFVRERSVKSLKMKYKNLAEFAKPDEAKEEVKETVKAEEVKVEEAKEEVAA